MIRSVEEGPASTSAPGLCLVRTSLSHQCSATTAGNSGGRGGGGSSIQMVSTSGGSGSGAFPTPSGSSRDHEKLRSGATHSTGNILAMCLTIVAQSCEEPGRRRQMWQGALRDCALGFLPTRGTARTGDESLRSLQGYCNADTTHSQSLQCGDQESVNVALMEKVQTAPDRMSSRSRVCTSERSIAKERIVFDSAMSRQPRGSDHIKVSGDAFHVLASVLGSCQGCAPCGELFPLGIRNHLTGHLLNIGFLSCQKAELWNTWVRNRKLAIGGELAAKWSVHNLQAVCWFSPTHQKALPHCRTPNHSLAK